MAQYYKESSGMSSMFIGSQEYGVYLSLYVTGVHRWQLADGRGVRQRLAGWGKGGGGGLPEGELRLGVEWGGGGEGGG